MLKFGNFEKSTEICKAITDMRATERHGSAIQKVYINSQ